MNKAIKLAIEKGGYLKNYGNGKPPAKYEITPYFLEVKYLVNSEKQKIPIERILVDPEFWLTLGKALEWSTTHHLDHVSVKMGFGRVGYEPKKHAHRYLDAKFEDREEEFWRSIIKG